MKKQDYAITPSEIVFWEGDVQHIIDHPRAKTLCSGIFVIKDFKGIKFNRRAVDRMLARRRTVYHATNEPAELDMFFSGRIVWYRPLSVLNQGSDPDLIELDLGNVPAGRLIIVRNE